MTLKVIQDWQDRCRELHMRAQEAWVEYQRANNEHTRAMDDEPRLCCTCDNFKDGRCAVFSASPPQEFQETPDACESWEVIVPF